MIEMYRTYSQRHEKQEEQLKEWKGEAPYKLRNRLIDAIYDYVRLADMALESLDHESPSEMTISNLSVKMFCKVRGLDHKRNVVYRLDDLENFMKEAPDNDFFDILEIVCVVYGRYDHPLIIEKCQQMYDEINMVLLDNGIPLKVIRGVLTDYEDPILTKEIVEPAFKMLKDEGLDVVGNHLLESFRFLRQKDNNHAIIEASMALESMLKIFLSKKGIQIKEDKYTIERLVEEVKKSVELPTEQKTSIVRVLDLAKNPANFRNKVGHGNAVNTEYDDSVTRYVIQNVASTIVFLSEIIRKEYSVE